MKITVEIDFNEPEKESLADILGCPANNLEHELSKYAKAATEEYVRMFLGQKVYTRGSDILEYRLFLLIHEAFGGRIPNEGEVSRLFQSTATGSRSHIRRVMSKFQSQLRTQIEGSLKQILGSCEVTALENGDLDEITATITSENLVDELNRVLGEIDGNLPPVTKKRNSITTFEMKPASYQKLCAKFGIGISQEDASK